MSCIDLSDNRSATQIDDDESGFDMNTTFDVPETPSLDEQEELNNTFVVPETPSLQENSFWDDTDPANFHGGNVGCYGCSYKEWGYRNMGLSQRYHMEWPTGCLSSDYDDDQLTEDLSVNFIPAIKVSVVKSPTHAKKQINQDATTQTTDTNEMSTQTDEFVSNKRHCTRISSVF